MSHAPEIPLQQSQPTITDLAEESTMDLLLWRHAEAEDGHPDQKRRLTARGEKQAQQMAEWLHQHAPKKLRILASPAVRCQQTAKALGLPFETDERIGIDSNVANLLAAVGWPDGGKEKKGNCSVLVIGHQPTLGQTAAQLTLGKDAYWTIKKGAVWWFKKRTRTKIFVFKKVDPTETPQDRHRNL